jgi:hypothetical protein
MLLLGVADCCRFIHRVAFTDFSVLLISITFCFDLAAFASFKRQTNGKNSKSFIERRDGVALIRCSKIPSRRVLDLPQYWRVTF